MVTTAPINPPAFPPSPPPPNRVPEDYPSENRTVCITTFFQTVCSLTLDGLWIGLRKQERESLEGAPPLPLQPLHPSLPNLPILTPAPPHPRPSPVDLGLIPGDPSSFSSVDSVDEFDTVPFAQTASRDVWKMCYAAYTGLPLPPPYENKHPPSVAEPTATPEAAFKKAANGTGNQDILKHPMSGYLRTTWTEMLPDGTEMGQKTHFT